MLRADAQMPIKATSSNRFLSPIRRFGTAYQAPSRFQDIERRPAFPTEFACPYFGQDEEGRLFGVTSWCFAVWPFVYSEMSTSGKLGSNGRFGDAASQHRRLHEWPTRAVRDAKRCMWLGLLGALADIRESARTVPIRRSRAQTPCHNASGYGPARPPWVPPRLFRFPWRSTAPRAAPRAAGPKALRPPGRPVPAPGWHSAAGRRRCGSGRPGSRR